MSTSSSGSSSITKSSETTPAYSPKTTMSTDKSVTSTSHSSTSHNSTSYNSTTHSTTPHSPTPHSSPTNKPTTTTPSPRKFEPVSFVGGIVLCAVIVAIGYFAYRFYKSRQDRNYQQF